MFCTSKDLSGERLMARRKPKSKPAFEVFNVLYEDGSRSSNRRVSSKLLDDRFGDDPIDLARLAIEEQDQNISVILLI